MFVNVSLKEFDTNETIDFLRFAAKVNHYHISTALKKSLSIKKSMIVNLITNISSLIYSRYIRIGRIIKVSINLMDSIINL